MCLKSSAICFCLGFIFCFILLMIIGSILTAKENKKKTRVATITSDELMDFFKKIENSKDKK